MGRQPRRRRASELRRRAPTREPAKRIRIFCEGKNTEPGYFDSVKRSFRLPNVEIEATGEGCDPLSLVRRAVEALKLAKKEAKRSRNSFDAKYEVWVVFDKDEFPNVPQARVMAAAHSVGIAMSNPCFELWAIYHFRDYNAPICSNDCQRMLAALCDKYEHKGAKRFELSFCATALEEQTSLIKTAITCADRGLASRAKEHDPNGCPSTEVGELMKVVLGNLIR